MKTVAGVVVLTVAGASLAAGQTTARYAALALSPDEGEPPPLACATPAVFARQLRSGFAPPGAMRMADAEPADGRPLWYDQNPRLLRADHVGGLSFDDFLVAGDVAALSFERRSSRADDTVRETWRRVRTTAIDGRLISVFNPAWNAAELWDTVAPYRRGFDRPRVYFGKLTLPDADTAADDEEEDEPFHVWLNTTPLNVPPAQVRRIDATAQYASHVVNLVIPDFGDGRLADWRYGHDLRSAARRFYRHFRDEYDSIAFVTRQHQLTPYGAFHRNVRNPIRGLGDLAVFDHARHYGSAGVLRSVEFYRDAAFAQTRVSTHEIGHQWADYWDWPALSGGVESAGHQPEAHTPLLYPGEAYLGAVLEVTRRVGTDYGDDGAAFVIERTPGPARLHPTTLYRMGLLETAAVPDLLVFEDQGQFTETDSTATPDTGAAVEGGARPVRINDVLAEHGLRTGPVDASWSRVTVVVSRDGLLSGEEMSYWNFFAARHAATGGVTSWEGVPSFFEATGGAVPLRTDVAPRRHARVGQEIATAPSIDPGEFRGVRLDEPLPTSVAAGETVTVAGAVTAADRGDFNGACMRWARYGASAEDRIFECARISGNRFSMSHRFTDAEAGRYALQFFLFWPDSGPQYPRANVSTITVTGGGGN